MSPEQKHYEHMEELKLARLHDCENDRENCDKVHPNIVARVVRASIPIPRNQDKHPPKWRDWLLEPKVSIGYMNRHTLEYKGFNLMIGFFDVPNLQEAREQIKELYLYAVEADWEEEHPI